ncbi:MAG: TolC family protein [Deltaproteobacteria bacterium]|nr:TolC family protein [Deltaproteobacteria bacterium]
MKSRSFRRLILLGWLTWSLTAAVPGGAAPAAPSLDLKEALGLAWKANPTMQISRLQSLIAGQEVVRARSGFLPTVKSEVSQTINDNEIQAKIPAGTIPGQTGSLTFPSTNRNYWSSKTYLDQTIFDFWGTPSRYQAAVLGKSASLLDTAKTRDDLFLNVAKGYFSTLRAQKLEVVATQDVADLKAHLKIARDQYEFGVVTYNDVLQAEVSLADAEQRLIVAKTDTIDIRSALNKVLALPVSAPTVLKDENLETRPWVLEQATDEALKQRSDLKASANRIQQQEKVVTQTKSQFYPRFYAQAGLNYQKNEFMLHDTTWFGIFGMQWTLFSGLDTKAQVAQARLKVNQLQEQHKDLDEQVHLDVQNAYLKVKETADRIRVTQKAVTQAEENLRLNEERYKEAVGTATDVIDAETLLTRTRVNYWTALYDHQMAKAELLWSMGAINALLPPENPDNVK